MGGCRCYFRECHVSHAKFPRMHFFRFPLKDPNMYEKWRQYSKMEHMLGFSEVRRKNTNICGRHFRSECFMNYKMDRLAPNAVPTIMRFSNEQALDFELDIENGVLVTMEPTKLKHLIPPDDFECPFFLMNDTVLIEKLMELKGRSSCRNEGKSITCPEIDVETPENTMTNSMENRETKLVTAPNRKRPIEIEANEELLNKAGQSNNKYKRVLKKSCEGDFETGKQKHLTAIIQLEDCLINRCEEDFVDAEIIDNSEHLMNDEDQFFLSAEVLNDCEQEIEFIENDSNDLHYEQLSNCATELKSDLHSQSSMGNTNDEFVKIKNQLSELKKKIKDLDILKIKYSVIEAEKKSLEKASEENSDTKKQLLALQIENNSIKKSLNDYQTLKDKLHEYCEENKKLKEKTANMEILKAEILSRKEESKELKKLLETLKNVQSENQELKEKFNLEIEKKRTSAKTNEAKLNEELKRAQQRLKHEETELEAVKSLLSTLKSENTGLIIRQDVLNKSLLNVQNDFEIKQNDNKTLKSDYDELIQKYTVLEEKYLKLQALKNQENRVSTSLENTNTNITSNSLTKAQLFNGIKRYLSSSMVSLLRMEMFGSSEREWKLDERQIAVDILRLGEMVYKYFTDEWRFRLPALRDAYNWLNQSQATMDEEVDL